MVKQIGQKSDFVFLSRILQKPATLFLLRRQIGPTQFRFLFFIFFFFLIFSSAHAGTDISVFARAEHRPRPSSLGSLVRLRRLIPDFTFV